MEPAQAFKCLFCPKQFSTYVESQNHQKKCSFAYCYLCFANHTLNPTNFTCNVCRSLCLECKNNHPSNDHIIKSITISIPAETAEVREGFSDKDPLGVLRQNQISNFLNEIALATKVLVRGPPFSGKSAFSFLTYSYLNSKKMNAFYVSCSQLSNPTNESFSKYWLEKVGQNWKEMFLDPGKKIFILDEVQRIYDDQLEFWGFFKDTSLKKDHLKLICFSGYGDQSTYFKSLTPISFDRAYGIDILSFNADEFTEIIEKFRNYYKIEITPRIKEHLKRTINNHCGLLKETLYFLANQTKKKPNLDEALLLSLLYSENYIGVIRATRAVPSLTTFPLKNSEIELLLDFALKPEQPDGYFVLTQQHQPIAKQLAKIGYFSELQEYKFKVASPIIRAIIFERFVNASKNPIPPSSFTYENFLLESLKRIDLDQLQHSKYSETSEGDLCERLWQMEFYRAAKSCLPQEIYINVDVGFCFDSNGYLDFYVNGKLNWAIELMRYNSKITDHLARFHQGGDYYNFAHNLEAGSKYSNFENYHNIEKYKWKVINFIPEDVKRTPYNGLWNVVYTKDYSRFYVYDEYDKMIKEIIKENKDKENN